MNYPTVTETIELFEIAIFENPDLDNDVLANTTDTASVNDTSTDSEITSTESTSTKKDKDAEDDFEFKFIPQYKAPPKYEVEEIPNAPQLGKRIYASVKSIDISQLGLMTIRLNETMILHRQEEYA